MLWFLFLACDKAPPQETGEPPLDCVGVGWETHARELVETCQGCHSSDLQGEERQGAPVGLDFDLPDGVEGFAAQMVSLATGPDAVMPPQGIDSALRERFALWVDCGLPELPRGACVGRTYEGDLLASTAPVDLCPTTRWVTGDLSIDADDAGLDCLCGVGGDLLIGEVESVDLPALSTLRGELILQSNPTLVRLGLEALERSGRVRVRDNPVLEEVDIGSLAQVGGSFIIRENPALTGLDLGGLAVVEGPIEVSQNASLAQLQTPRSLVDHADAIEISALPELSAVRGFPGLLSVAGAIRMEGLGLAQVVAFPDLRSAGSVQLVNWPAMGQLRAFGAVEVIGGTLRVAEIGPVPSVDLFGQVRTVGGGLVVDRFRGRSVIGFPLLEQVDGALEISNNAALVELRFPLLSSTGGLSIHDDPQLPDLLGLQGLGAVGGNLEIYRNGSLSTLAGLENLTVIEGGFRLESLPALTNLSALDGLTEIRGDLVLVDLPNFDQVGLDARFSGVDVLGSVTIEP